MLALQDVLSDLLSHQHAFKQSSLLLKQLVVDFKVLNLHSLKVLYMQVENCRILLGVASELVLDNSPCSCHTGFVLVHSINLKLPKDNVHDSKRLTLLNTDVGRVLVAREDIGRLALLKEVNGLDFFLLPVDWHILDQNDNLEKWTDPLNEVVISLLIEELDLLLSQSIHVAVHSSLELWVELIQELSEVILGVLALEFDCCT